ncbi:MAG TPA: ABC transporter substrate-binding protein [Arenibaculum sp.]|nr:ABC transporter substrate-binding protein [Arenibaculum sp.]
MSSVMTRRSVLAGGIAAAVLSAAAFVPPGLAAGRAVRIGLLKFGTVNWEIDTLMRNGLDEAHGIELEVVDLASNQATQIALQSGAVDVIVSDWLWVARQRAAGEALSFIPYSTSVGAVVVPADSDIRTVGDLAGRRIGIAGSPLDKGWLMLRALARDRYGIDLETQASPFFGAPAVMSEQIRAGRLDGVLNYWHYAARLEAEGMRRLIDVGEIQRDLGITVEVPAIGYVFKESWAEADPGRVGRFAAASAAAKQRLLESDEEWERLRPLVRAEDDATLSVLRDRYREGIPRHWGQAEREAAADLFALMAKLGGRDLVGDATALPEGTFWPGVAY